MTHKSTRQQITKKVKAAAQGLAATLPAQLLCEVTGLLLSTLCEDLLGKPPISEISFLFQAGKQAVKV